MGAIRFVNLDELHAVINSGNENVIKTYLKLHDAGFNDKKNKPSFSIRELKEFHDLMNNLGFINNGVGNYSRGYIVGLKIDFVMEQFDILRIEENKILNIELKSEPIDEKDILKQLRCHRWYLMAGKTEEINGYFLTYCKSTNKFYKLNKQNKLEEVEKEAFIEIIKYFRDEPKKPEIDTDKFIISPYDNINSFEEHDYFLTEEQIKAENKIIEQVDNNKFKKFIIEGTAGTGKSLLVFDIAKKFSKRGKKVRIIQEAAQKINSTIASNGFIIEDIQTFKDKDNASTDDDVVIFDEAQRLYGLDYNIFKKLNEGVIILAMDPEQTLHSNEKKRTSEFLEKVKENSDFSCINLKNRVRYSGEIKGFIDQLWKNKQNNGFYEYENVDIIYCSNTEEAKVIINNKIVNENFTPIEFTPKTNNFGSYENIWNYSKTPHKVLGREFNNTLVIFNNWIIFKEDKLNFLTPEGYPFLVKNSVYEMLTRAKEKLCILVIGNMHTYISLERIVNSARIEMQKSKEKERERDTGLNKISDYITNNPEEKEKLDSIIKQLYEWQQESNFSSDVLIDKVRSLLKKMNYS